MRPGVHDFIRGIWPIREGFYMVQILTPTMEFLAWQQGGREGAPPPPPRQIRVFWNRGFSSCGSSMVLSREPRRFTAPTTWTFYPLTDKEAL